MKIALIGYGKMGKAIEQIAIERGHQIVLKINSTNKELFTEENLKHSDVAIEFTNPENAVDNILKCLNAGVAIVSGSTGWNNRIEEVENYCKSKNGALIHASNFSIGVNIFFELNKKLASMMNHRDEYKATIEEIHHTAKKDAPSGTAISLAEQIIDINKKYHQWKLDDSSENNLAIFAKRIDPAPGTHIIKYESEIDEIEIKHTAKNRIGFATGAVVAAEFLYNKKGIFSMKEVLGI